MGWEIIQIKLFKAISISGNHLFYKTNYRFQALCLDSTISWINLGQKKKISKRYLYHKKWTSLHLMTYTKYFNLVIKRGKLLGLCNKCADKRITEMCDVFYFVIFTFFYKHLTWRTKSWKRNVFSIHWIANASDLICSFD